MEDVSEWNGFTAPLTRPELLISHLELNTASSENPSWKPWLSLAHLLDAPMMPRSERRSSNIAQADLELLVLLPLLLEVSDRRVPPHIPRLFTP